MNNSESGDLPAPKALIIGLDRCLLDCGGSSFSEMQPPFVMDAGELYDGNDNPIRVSPETHVALQWCVSKEIPLVLLSSCTRPDIARHLIKNLELDSYFFTQCIGAEPPEVLIRSLRKRRDLEFDDLLYIDYIHPGIGWCEPLGMTGFNISAPLTRQSLAQALDLFHINRP